MKPNSIFVASIKKSSRQGFCPINADTGYCKAKKGNTISPVIINSKFKIEELKKPEFFKEVELERIKKYKTYGHFFMFSGVDKEGNRKVVVNYRDKKIAELFCDDIHFVFFKGSVPLSIGIVTQNCKYPADAQHHNPSERELTLTWFYDKGITGPIELNKLSDIDSNLVGIFKLKYDTLLVLTQDMEALIYGKSYNSKGKFTPKLLSKSGLSREFGANDVLLKASTANKEFLLIKYTTEYEDEDDERCYLIIFRINRLSKIFKITDSHEEYPDRKEQKHFIQLIDVKGGDNQEGDYMGILIKYYTTEGKNIFINFWKLDSYGKFTGVFHKLKIATLSKSGFKKMSNTGNGDNGVEKVKYGFGYDFIWLYGSDKIIRVIYDTQQIISSTESVDQDISKVRPFKEQQPVVEKLDSINKYQIKEQENVSIPLEELQLNFEEQHTPVHFYESHHKALGDSKSLNPLYFTTHQKAKDFGSRMKDQMNRKMTNLFSKNNKTLKQQIIEGRMKEVDLGLTKNMTMADKSRRKNLLSLLDVEDEKRDAGCSCNLI